MKIHDYTANGRVEAEVLHGMATDASVLGRVAALWTDLGLFAGRAPNVIGSLCVDFHRKYSKAPGSGLASLVREWGESQHDKSTVELVDKLATAIISCDSVIVPESLIDAAGRHFRTTALNMTLDASRADLDAGKLGRAEDRIAKYSKIEMGVGAGFHIDKPHVESAFAQNAQERLIHYGQDALDSFFHNELERTGFMVFAAPQKAGKTHMLVDMAIRAHRERRRVAFFEIGDLSENQLKQRLLVRVARWPHRSEGGRWPYTVAIPKGITCGRGREEVARVDYSTKTYDVPLDAKRAWAAWEREKEERVKSKKEYFKASVHGNLSISILGIRSILETWARNGWSCDILVIDYLDNLAPVDKREENRDRVNTTWKLVRAMAIEMGLLVVSATQVNAAGFNKRWLDRTNFSEDNRKLSHVTAMAGINVTPEEKDKGICRLNWICKREGAYSVQTGPHVGMCLPIGNPAVVSCWPERD